MELTDITNSITDGQKLARLRQVITSTRPERELLHAREQYNPKTHRIVKDLTYRPNKLVNVDMWEGEGEDAVKKTVQTTVQVARLTLPYQKRIVNMRATFLCGNPIELAATPDESKQVEQDLLDVLKKVWEDNKLDYKSKKLAKVMMSQTEVAELWYIDPATPDYWTGTVNADTPYQLGMKILDSSNSDGLYPVYDKYGDMIAFCREYTRIEYDLNMGGKSKKVLYFDIYTKDYTYNCVEEKTGFKVVEKAANPFGKIPIIYYKQDAPEWDDVQPLIDRLELSKSNHADTNDYHGSPTVKVKGKVEGFSRKGEAGKVLELDGEGADAEYMSWDKSPESVKLEQDNLKADILEFTSTPNLSFDNIKGLGQFSGIALKLLFQDAHMAASDKEETFGEGIQRRINLLKSALVYINPALKDGLTLSIKPKFNYFLPKNDLEYLQMLSTATSGDKPLMSQEEAVKQNPLIEDGDAEWDKVEAEQKAADKSAMGLNKVMNMNAA